jgi:hypothetical protein
MGFLSPEKEADQLQLQIFSRLRHKKGPVGNFVQVTLFFSFFFVTIAI